MNSQAADAPRETPDMQGPLNIQVIPDFPIVRAGDDIAQQIGDAMAAAELSLQDGNVIVLAQKIVSLSEGRTVRLDDVDVSAAAKELAAQTDKDPRIVELILRESEEIIRHKAGVIIARHRLGLISANAGIDQSNIDQANGECALLLPDDPDQSASRLRQALMTSTGKKVAVVISDSMSRPWRLGTIGTAIGSAGIDVLDDRRGESDLYGRELKVTMINRADSIAAAAVLLMGEATERTPVAIVRGLAAEDSTQAARECVRPLADDLFL